VIKIRPEYSTEHSTEHQERWIEIDQLHTALGGTHTKEGYLEFEEDGD